MFPIALFLFILFIPAQLVHSGFNAPCTTSSNCTQNQICISQICQCKDGYLLNLMTNDCDKISCYNDIDCRLQSRHSQCKDGVCKCSSGYTQNQTTGFCEIFNPCLNNSAEYCNSNQICRNGKCQCKNGYHWNDNYGCHANDCKFDSNCGKHSRCKFSEFCQCDHGYELKNNNNCIPLNNCASNGNCATNFECRYNRCLCKTGFHLNDADQVCIKSECSNDLECSTKSKHFKCINWHCQCSTGYSLINGHCEVVNNCTQNWDCATHFECTNDGRCQCQNGYLLNQTQLTCDVVRKCKNNFDCTKLIGHSYCEGNICKCSRGYRLNQTNAFCEVSTNCKNFADCPAKFDCENGHCQCKKDYHFNQTQLTCDLNECSSYTKCTGEHLFCLNGFCKCKRGFEMTNQTSRSCKIVKECKNNEDCPEHFDCKWNSTCGCTYGYHLDKKYEICLKDECEHDYECMKNSKCKGGLCYCEHGYNKFWQHIDGKDEPECDPKDICSSNADCPTNWNFKCIDSWCKCSGIYNWNQENGKCQIDLPAVIAISVGSFIILLIMFCCTAICRKCCFKKKLNLPQQQPVRSARNNERLSNSTTRSSQNSRNTVLNASSNVPRLNRQVNSRNRSTTDQIELQLVTIPTAPVELDADFPPPYESLYPDIQRL